MGKNSSFMYILLGLLVLIFLFGVFYPALNGGNSLYDDFTNNTRRGKADTGESIERDTTPRIMYWSGMINQHVDGSGNRLSDPDKKSSSHIDKYKYCKKWYPKTLAVKNYKLESISTWVSLTGFVGLSGNRISIECIQP